MVSDISTVLVPIQKVIFCTLESLIFFQIIVWTSGILTNGLHLPVRLLCGVSWCLFITGTPRDPLLRSPDNRQRFCADEVQQGRLEE